MPASTVAAPRPTIPFFTAQGDLVQHDMTLFECLRDSHDIQRQLCLRLVRAKDNLALRESTFLQLKVELEAHAAAEERFLYVPLLMEDAGLSVSRHALSEHHEIEELCEALSVPDKSGDGWMDRAQELSRTVRHHLKEEESGFFQLAGRLLSDAQKARLAKQVAKEVVRMRRLLAAPYASLVVDATGHLAPAPDSGAAEAGGANAG